MRPVLGQALSDVPVHLGDVVDPVQATGDPGLVGHDRDRDAGPVEPGDGFGRASMNSTRSTEPT